jgi:hypothetical protein
MTVENRWTECLAAVGAVANKAVDNGASGIELHFFNSNNVFKFKDEIRGVAVRIHQYISSLIFRYSRTGQKQTISVLGIRPAKR